MRIKSYVLLNNSNLDKFIDLINIAKRINELSSILVINIDDVSTQNKINADIIIHAMNLFREEITYYFQYCCPYDIFTNEAVKLMSNGIIIIESYPYHTLTIHNPDERLRLIMNTCNRIEKLNITGAIGQLELYACPHLTNVNLTKVNHLFITRCKNISLQNVLFEYIEAVNIHECASITKIINKNIKRIYSTNCIINKIEYNQHTECIIINIPVKNSLIIDCISENRLKSLYITKYSGKITFNSLAVYNNIIDTYANITNDKTTLNYEFIKDMYDNVKELELGDYDHNKLPIFPNLEIIKIGNKYYSPDVINKYYIQFKKIEKIKMGG